MTRAELRQRIARLRQMPTLAPRPTCPWCGRQVAPEAFGQEACQPCEAERAQAIEDYHRDDYQPPAPLTEPFGDGSEPFTDGVET